MFVNNARSVSEALSQGLHYLSIAGRPQESRVGTVLVAPEPVITVYSDPRCRVLFSPLRDANPFFHLFESLWMLAGRNDLPWLVQFNKKFSAYSDDGGKTQPAAYGHRWRNYFGYDQLDMIIDELKRNPETRRCVLTMWSGSAGGVAYHASDLQSAINGSADVPCNTHAYFDTVDGRLNMTVCCRSNDVIWGAYGANAVHFSFLLEFMAAAAGLPMGAYRQLSNNYHIYTNVVAQDQMMPMARDVLQSDRYLAGAYALRKPVDLRRTPLMAGYDDHQKFLEHLAPALQEDALATTIFETGTFLHAVAQPMFMAWQAHKAKDYNEALHIAESVRSQDWQIACVEWLTRRKLKAEVNASRFTDIVEI